MEKLICGTACQHANGITLTGRAQPYQLLPNRATVFQITYRANVQAYGCNTQCSR